MQCVSQTLLLFLIREKKGAEAKLAVVLDPARQETSHPNTERSKQEDVTTSTKHRHPATGLDFPIVKSPSSLLKGQNISGLMWVTGKQSREEVFQMVNCLFV